MEYGFFYGSIIILWIIFIICMRFKPVTLANIIIGITTIAYSLLYEILLGEYFDLYYYIKNNQSILYILLAGIFVYPILNIIYTLFLPKKIKPILIYTGLWIIAMLIFEYLSLLTKTVVFTGWRMFPWSPLTYVLTYLWVYLFYRYLEKRITD
ncbi:hypothetical protein BX659_103108 [Orenia metallireducens]|jgi:hypothetical protein|uniref:Uncharacterized protein n=1 Tax=Orenia metallireducens TaxID=1413210 RepID=A0A285FJ67_9FIRM|nr:hypothetical protein [Orenia metallireducens]PRX33581.1 hypothetical protein BX659_103108 [Orenia metallireducens]SNY11317.1 hypothetical protein SAMN06265827_102108 [Orenia metallireducens]